MIRHISGRLNVADALTRKAEYNFTAEELKECETEMLKKIDHEIVVQAIEVSSSKERQKIMKTRHDTIFSGHPGIKKTFQLIRKDFYWPKMLEEIQDYVKGCLVCQRKKIPRKKSSGLLMPLKTPSHPFSEVTMDFIVGLPLVNNYNAVLVFVDRFTKFAIFVPPQIPPQQKRSPITT